jgi:uncharacterized protein YecE (DUF72 family)
MTAIRIGTAGWSVLARYANRFPADGAHLERYARALNAVEVNTSFYRPHQRATYERWAASVPEGFRFAVKLPKTATHAARLVDTAPILDRFLDEVRGLGDRLGPLLVQLPPKLAFDPGAADAFFAALRERHDGPAACEPRHASWFEPAAEALLVRHRVARVAADPPAGSPRAARPGGWSGLAYYRLHGSPRIYFSDYPPEVLARVADDLLRAAADEVWCIFDNTAGSEALGDALDVMDRVRG